MESMRDINRVMEREIAKGSSPLKLEHIEFGEYSYQEITSTEKLLEVLSYLLRIGDFSQYAGKTCIWICVGKSRYSSEHGRQSREITYLQQSKGMQGS
ncbi:hypothetical protein [Clostridium fessum]|uniref:hypothetical protein n=1 Tax=Clostridium fessum TaxID=2126740 RepID=UPI0039916F19